MVGNILVTGITFGVFMTEALIHYNMGQAKAKGKFELRMPPPKELAKIAAVTGVFSLVSGAMIGQLERHMRTR
jgi:hypothetical protein